MIILYSESKDLSDDKSINLLISSTELLEAASISMNVSTVLLILLARILANVVFPHPDGPHIRIKFLNVLVFSCCSNIFIILF